MEAANRSAPIRIASIWRAGLMLVDGVVGPRTWGALVSDGRQQSRPPSRC